MGRERSFCYNVQNGPNGSKVRVNDTFVTGESAQGRLRAACRTQSPWHSHETSFWVQHRARYLIPSGIGTSALCVQNRPREAKSLRGSFGSMRASENPKNPSFMRLSRNNRNDTLRQIIARASPERRENPVSSTTCGVFSFRRPAASQIASRRDRKAEEPRLCIRQNVGARLCRPNPH